ncbi:ABC transporter permease [Streptacidiphilus sp. ASG 303]|uniref:ABC transporter permease n=1 Tax=Streptacidiphilus sp. ASG 303 TaxID=2896847 RepID=UPI001E59469F|nr:ABC transporter permease [Streptacidiphilus sp. ASG 303]MCD0485688.1 ABC transporter permease [Streptacidiphilus sp. ASG 303]
MGRFLLRRLANYMVLVIVASCLAYFLAALSLNPRSNFESKNPRPPEAVISKTLQEYNLDPHTPVFERFGHWAADVATGNLGKNVKGGSVNDDFGRRVGVSVRLLLISTLLGSLGGVFLGAWGAIRQYRFFDRFTTLGSFFVLAMPIFVIAISLELLAVNFNHAAGSTVLQYTGEYDPDVNGFWAQLLSRFNHLILPTLTLVLVQMATYSRYQRNTMLDVLGSDFLRTARAKGLRRRTALIKHGLRTAVLPIVPLLVYNVVLLFTGATFTEKIFNWHGMGEWLVDSINTNDTNSVAAVSLFTAVVVLVAGLLSDVIYAALDPRVRVS